MSMSKTCSYCQNLLKPRWADHSFFVCPKCGLLFRNQEDEPRNLAQLYQTSWEDPFNKVDETGGTSSRHARYYVDRLLKSLHKPSFQGYRILDFGAGRGNFTVELQNNGAEVRAVEPYGYEFLKKRGIHTVRGLAELEGQKLFDGIVSLNVIEHLAAPWDEITQLRRLLIPGGWIFLATPNRSSLNATLHGPRWREARRQGHIVLFNSKSLSRVLTGCGFENPRWLRWYFPYDSRPAARIKDWLLQMARLDGELKYLARSPAGPD